MKGSKSLHTVSICLVFFLLILSGCSTSADTREVPVPQEKDSPIYSGDSAFALDCSSSVKNEDIPLSEEVPLDNAWHEVPNEPFVPTEVLLSANGSEMKIASRQEVPNNQEVFYDSHSTFAPMVLTTTGNGLQNASEEEPCVAPVAEEVPELTKQEAPSAEENAIEVIAPRIDSRVDIAETTDVLVKIPGMPVAPIEESIGQFGLKMPDSYVVFIAIVCVVLVSLPVVLVVKKKTKIIDASDARNSDSYGQFSNSSPDINGLLSVTDSKTAENRSEMTDTEEGKAETVSTPESEEDEKPEDDGFDENGEPTVELVFLAKEEKAVDISEEMRGVQVDAFMGTAASSEPNLIDNLILKDCPSTEKLKQNCHLIKNDQACTKAIVRGHLVEFTALDHQYKVDGKNVPSITQLIKEYGPQIYANVNPTILARAATRGTMMHNTIERFELNGMEDPCSLELVHYIDLKKRMGFVPVATEFIVILFEEDGKPLAAGRVDFMIKSGPKDKVGIMDLKRTSRYHEDNVSLQLNMYRRGLLQSYGLDVDQLICLRLRDSEAEYHNVEISDDQMNRILSKVR